MELFPTGAILNLFHTRGGIVQRKASCCAPTVQPSLLDKILLSYDDIRLFICSDECKSFSLLKCTACE